MKKQLILVLSLSTCFINACVEVEPLVDESKNKDSTVAINSFYPNAAACGSEITLYGENFGFSNSDNFVSIDWWGTDAHSGRIAEVTNTSNPGKITVRIPMNLNPGDYQISLMVKGKSSRIDQPFKIISDL